MALENIKNPSVILFRLDDFTPININKKLAIILKEIPQSQLLSGLFITVKEKNIELGNYLWFYKRSLVKAQRLLLSTSTSKEELSQKI